MPGCFLNDRRSVIVFGADASGFGMVKLNLDTGRNEEIDFGELNRGVHVMGELSPDGKRIATIRSINGSFQEDCWVQLIDLETAKCRNLGMQMQIGGPCSWLPDGNELVVKRLESKGESNSVAKRTICRLELNGKLTDLCPGDWPVVLRKSRKILYQQNDSKLWHTCDLDGSHSELFADGFKGYVMPAVSPDESKILFVRDDINHSQLVLIEMGKSTGKPVRHVAGFTARPVWR